MKFHQFCVLNFDIFASNFFTWITVFFWYSSVSQLTSIQIRTQANKVNLRPPEGLTSWETWILSSRFSHRIGFSCLFGPRRLSGRQKIHAPTSLCFWRCAWSQGGNPAEFILVSKLTPLLLFLCQLLSQGSLNILAWILILLVHTTICISVLDRFLSASDCSEEFSTFPSATLCILVTFFQVLNNCVFKWHFKIFIIIGLF